MSPPPPAVALTNYQSSAPYSGREAESSTIMHPAETTTPAKPPSRIIASRVGEVEVLDENVLTFPRGLLGFEGKSEYAILNLPHEGMERFKLLQSAEDAEAGFLVVEASNVADALDPADLHEAYNQCDVRPADALTLLIVSVRRDGEGIELTANLRAPVVIDAKRRVGRQHVMSNGAYPIRFVL